MRRCLAFLLAPIGAVTTFLGPPFISSGRYDDIGWLVYASIVMVFGWIAQVTLAMPLLRRAARRGRTGWDTTLAIGTLVGTLFGMLYIALMRLLFWELTPSDYGEMLKAIGLCAAGGAVSAALHRLIAPPAVDRALRPIS